MSERLQTCGCLLALALIHGFFALSCDGLQTDGIYALLHDLGWQAKWMPLHGALIQGAVWFGVEAERAGRLLSALAAVLLYYPVHALVSRMRGASLRGHVVLVLAFTPLIARYAGLVLNDLLFCLCCLNAVSAFLLHGRWFPLWFGLVILTRPEGWVLLPLAVVWHLYHSRGRWISVLSVVLACAWMWGRTGSFALGQEWAGGVMTMDIYGWGAHAFSTLALVLVMGWPAISPMMDSRIRGNDEGNKHDFSFETPITVMGGLFLLMWLLPSLTSTWSGRRALPLLVLLAPWTALGLLRSRWVMGIWMAASILLCSGVWAGLRHEYGELKEACHFVLRDNPTGIIYVDDLRRCQWWLRPVPLEKVRPWHGQKLDQGDRLILWSRRRPLDRPGVRMLASSCSLNMFGDGIWWREGHAVSQEPPRCDEWGRWNLFEAAVYSGAD